MYLIVTALSALVVSSMAFHPTRPLASRTRPRISPHMTAEAYPGALPPTGYFDPWSLARSRTPAEVWPLIPMLDPTKYLTLTLTPTLTLGEKDA